MPGHEWLFMLSVACILVHALLFLHFQAPITGLRVEPPACSHPGIWVGNFDFDFQFWKPILILDFDFENRKAGPISGTGLCQD
jgi:hypothetical protein